ncbi:MAG TPA: acyl-CoA reductase, partial [Pseudonocardiaceae bacterium]
MRVVLLPAIVRGRAVAPAWPRVADLREGVAARGRVVLGPTADGTYLVCRPVIDRATLEPTGATQVLVLPAVHPAALVEPDPAAAVAGLMRLPFAEVCSFVDAVGVALRSGLADPAGALLTATSQLGDRAHHAALAQVCGLFDGDAVRAMLERDLRGPAEELLDRWTPVPDPAVRGLTARMADRTPGLAPDPADDGHAADTGAADPGAVTDTGARDGRDRDGPPRPLVRGLPTRQLHLTAGNAPVVAVTSLLWGWATRGACVVKPAADTAGLVAALGTALAAVGADHPLARHTTLAYWRGGDPAVEDVLLADGAFDRRVVWGSAATVDSVLRRGGATDTIVLRPRHAVSLIGAAAVRDDLAGTVRRAAVDSLVADQNACMSSLLHVVEGTDADADAYAVELAAVLARWDEALPHTPSPAVTAALVGLRRGRLATARWYVNGSWPRVSSAVVRHQGGLDLRRHPGGRLVLVRAVPRLRDVLGELGPDVSTAGVAPGAALDDLRDELAAAGVDNVLPLGEAERGHAGRPHDGMRVLGRLIR